MAERSRYAYPSPARRKRAPALRDGHPTFELLKPHKRLQRLQKWIAANGALHLSLREAARIADLEPHHLSAVFHQCIGRTFLEWTRTHRIACAIQALERNQLSIDEVAELVGYESRRSLVRAVKCTTGMTPSEVQSTRGDAGPAVARYKGS